MHLRSRTELKLALGGDVELTLVGDLPDQEMNRIFAELWLQIFMFEQRFSRFINTSELSRFNRRSGSFVGISEDFRDMLLAAQRMSLFTDGQFNPFILPMLQKTGYRKSFVRQYQNDWQDDFSTCRVASPNEITINENTAHIPEGTALDFGGCGKGHLADILSLNENLGRLQGYWFSIGGDIAGAGTDEFDMPWEVCVQNAADPKSMLDISFTVPTEGFFIATSGVIERIGTNGKSRWHHLIDPETGCSASTDILLATVSANTALQADVLASCAVIQGSDSAIDYLVTKGANSGLIQSRLHSRKVEFSQFGSMIKKRELVCS